MPVASVIHDRFLSLIAMGAGDLDLSAPAALTDRPAGNASVLASAN
jgi:hypothetical protein